MAQYPRLGSWTRPRLKSNRACAVCGNRPAGFQWVEVSIFRGEDEVINVCRECSKTRKDEVLTKWQQRQSPDHKSP